jgi:hypothetical protein
MKLTVFNGSPRGKKSNTGLLLDQFLEGFVGSEGNVYELHYLQRVREQDRFLEAFRQADCVLLAYPLYVDAMPGLVKEFIETLGPLAAAGPRRGDGGHPDGGHPDGGRWHGTRRPALGFLVQSGFPEACHSRPVERYNRKLAERLGCRYFGTIVKGGVEGIQVKPPWMTRRLYERFYDLGETFGRSGELDPMMLRQLARPERLSLPMRLLYRLLDLTGVSGSYWNWMLKKNGAYDQRFARPYA